jgi:hypothetical protein
MVSIPEFPALPANGTSACRRVTAALGVLAATLLLCACELVTPKVETPHTPPPVAQEDISQYLDTMYGLVTGDPARQADIFYELEREYTRAPTTTTSLRFALALITPAHPATKPAEGKRILETLLASPERMLPLERKLATLMLREADARLKMDGDNRRLLATVDERVRTQANSDRRLQAQAEENLRLRRELAEAKQKLDAITDIERSITIERSPSPPGSRDNPNEAQSSTPGR